MTSYLASYFATQVRTVTDHDNDTQVTDAQLFVLMDPIVRVVQRQCADIAPDLFTAVSNDATVAAGASTIDLAAAPLSLINVGKVRTVERKTGVDYVPVPLAPVLMGSQPGYLGWRLRGDAFVEFAPVASAQGTYRVKYLTKAPAITTGTDAVTLPDGADMVIVERTAARVRRRFEEDPNPHEAAAQLAWTDLRAALIRTYPTMPMPVINVRGRW